MTVMLCRNRVADFDAWYKLFTSNAAANEAAGLRLMHVWQCQDDPNDVYFVFDVSDKEKALAFIAAPESHEMGERSGVLDGEYHFCDEPGG